MHEERLPAEGAGLSTASRSGTAGHGAHRRVGYRQDNSTVQTAGWRGLLVVREVRHSITMSADTVNWQAVNLIISGRQSQIASILNAMAQGMMCRRVEEVLYG
ncbi:hypothetical protein AB0I49_02130 [Streptomyces sp. NPDC050617]|uniref:hypothetical protein n=1 Tax=Streptomyces sp. NPDC050617 TaxID=3154628 RepID=UPI00342BA9BD